MANPVHPNPYHFRRTPILPSTPFYVNHWWAVSSLSHPNYDHTCSPPLSSKWMLVFRDQGSDLEKADWSSMCSPPWQSLLRPSDIRLEDGVISTGPALSTIGLIPAIL
ncbi:hypothetical protein I7I51_06603 [Histoplasma capsulatum]|uniref:Uncharacterized protein n=1 Tax=Ajellomyces capsulatus TaxID=5037 RepID=A0A8A1MM45_AJECA|nr:hypothetical protein I7I51_06603 [Histoplasma capsulatum]